MERIKVGTFEVKSGYIVATDPCYTEILFGAKFPIKNGKYNVYVVMDDFGEWGTRVTLMEAVIAEEDYNTDDLLWEYSGSNGGVDSGTFSFLDKEYYERTRPNEQLDEDWYEENVVEMDDYLIAEGCEGAICSSGFGDGSYPIYVTYESYDVNCNRIDGIRVVFLEDDDDC